jgi:hypothetical protein
MIFYLSALLLAGSSGVISRENWKMEDMLFLSLISYRFEKKLVYLPSFDTVLNPLVDLGRSSFDKLCSVYINIINIWEIVSHL